MKQARSTLGVLLSAVLMMATPAAADYVVKDGNGTSQTIKAGTLGGFILPWYLAVDASGAAFGVSGNPFFINPATPASWAIGATGSAVPANAHYWGVNVSGNQVGVTGLALGATTKAPTVAIVDASGNQVTSFGGSGGTASNFGSVFPSAGTAIGLTDGTNMVGAKGDTTNGIWANIKTSVLPTGAATSALQGTNTATTTHTCSIAGFSELGCLGQIDDDIKGPIAAGTAIIGKVTTDQTTHGTTDLVAADITKVNGAAISATNGLYANVLQGNAALSATNGTFANILQGNAALTATNTLFSGISQGGNTAAVKAASTAAASTDPAAVVQLNPLSPGIITLGPATIANSLATIPSSQYPGNATAAANPVTGNAAGTTAAVVGTLAAAASKTTFICGFTVEAVGGTAAVGPITVAGLVGSSMVFQMFSSATGTSKSQTFSPCVPASAANTAITITTTADGTATAVDVNSWGYQL